MAVLQEALWGEGTGFHAQNVTSHSKYGKVLFGIITFVCMAFFPSLLHRLTVLQMSDAMKCVVTVSSSESAYTSTTNVTFPKPSRVEKISKDSPRKDLKSLWPFQNLVYTFLSDAKHAEIFLTDLTLVVLVLTQSGCLIYLLTLKV